nr:HAT, C-terminal dimerization domain containing protein [Ipomoea batatas]GMC52848.1 HAT, C-terminal dimerization domain containing protein [Ipomoea batatas]GMC78242.1 HAT, C-terminal dimerization domain containing protein [Ipomoea batatas]
MEFEQCVEVGSYFGSGREGEDEGNVASGGSVSNRGIRGPIDRYMVKGNSSGEQTTTIAPPQNAKELRQQMHRHLHEAAYYLNPRCHYSPDFSTHPEIKLGLFHCLDKLIPNRDDMEKADLQCSAFHRREGFFGLAQAKNTVHKRTPVEWWTQYGDGTPELQKFAIKVLGLTCSFSRCERNWSAFNQDRHLKLKSLVNDEDSLLIDELSSDDEWLVGENDEDAPHLSVDDLDVDVFEGEPSQATQTQPNESSSKKVSAKGGSKHNDSSDEVSL